MSQSHHTEENITCPNCGSKATGNFCYQCGQETHLHKETFWGLVMHFAGHYFHYDSKFWKTMKALWFSPGQLTVAYREKQRMRYIPPISLYIFISAVFFLCTYLGGSQGLLKLADKKSVTTHTTTKNEPGDVVDLQINEPNIDPDSKAVGFFEKKQGRIIEEHGSMGAFFIEKINDNIPKLFFFMIPVMALILKAFYLRRKDLLFVDHAIFSLHYHSFWFSVFILGLIHFPAEIKQWIYVALFSISAVYLTAALHKVYASGWIKSIVYMLSLSVIYTIMLVIALIIDLCIIILMA